MIPTWNLGYASTENNLPVTGTGLTVSLGDTLTVISLNGGRVSLGMKVSGPGIQAGTTIIAFIGGLGGIGTYQMSVVAGVGFGTGAITLTR